MEACGLCGERRRVERLGREVGRGVFFSFANFSRFAGASSSSLSLLTSSPARMMARARSSRAVLDAALSLATPDCKRERLGVATIQFRLSV